MLNMTVAGAFEILRRLERVPGAMHAALVRKRDLLGDKLVAKIRANLSGGMLQVKSGRLLASVQVTKTDTQDLIQQEISVGEGVPYARILHDGGQTAAHDIYPTKAKALAFLVGNKMAFAKVVHHPGSKFPARPYAQQPLAEMRGEILAGVQEAVVEGMRAP